MGPDDKLWVRYVDDMFVIWPHGTDRLHSFHQHLNQQHPKIQFTVEEEKDVLPTPYV